MTRIAHDIHQQPAVSLRIAPDVLFIPTVETLAQALQMSIVHGLATIDSDLPAPTLIIEPGRSIVARAGVAVYRIGARKKTSSGITYIFVDGGMADNIRPALYGAHYHALAVEHVSASPEEEVRIAGRYCESGDVLIENVTLPYLQEGDLLALPMAGAYCLPMASNYNLVPRPAVILVDEGMVQVMERRETFADMLSRYQDIEEAWRTRIHLEMAKDVGALKRHFKRCVESSQKKSVLKMHDFEEPTEPMSQVFLPPYSIPTFQTDIFTDQNAIPAPQLDEVPFPKSGRNPVDVSGMSAIPPMYPILPPAAPTGPNSNT